MNIKGAGYSEVHASTVFNSFIKTDVRTAKFAVQYYFVPFHACNLVRVSSAVVSLTLGNCDILSRTISIHLDS